MIFISIVCFFIFATCNKNPACKEIQYSFDMKTQVSPQYDSVLVNDTIWFSVSSSTNMLDLNSNTVIEYSNAENLGTSFQFLELIDLNNGASDAALFFDQKVIKGSYTGGINTARDKQYKFFENSGKYDLFVGFVPKKKGIYALAISNASNVVKASSTTCTKANVSITIENGVNQHLYFYQNNRPGYTISEYERAHMYCFKVK